MAVSYSFQVYFDVSGKIWLPKPKHNSWKNKLKNKTTSKQNASNKKKNSHPPPPQKKKKKKQKNTQKHKNIIAEIIPLKQKNKKLFEAPFAPIRTPASWARRGLYPPSFRRWRSSSLPPRKRGGCRGLGAFGVCFVFFFWWVLILIWF